MVLPLALVTISFVIISFISNASVVFENSFLGYIFTQLLFITNNITICIVGFGLLCFVVWPKKYSHKIHFSRRIWVAFFRALEFLVLGFFLAYVALFIIAFVHLNILAIFLNISPHAVGVTADRNAVIKELKNDYFPPKIVTSDTDQYKELLVVASTTTGVDNLYGSEIISSIPRFFIIPTKKPKSSVLSVGNTIIITHMNEADLEAISPLIGHLFIEHYFWGRSIMSDPNISVLDERSYIQFRQKDSKKKAALITSDIQKVDDKISSLSADIQRDEEGIVSAQNLIQQIYSQENAQYSSCMSVGEFRDEVFYHIHSKGDCQKQISALVDGATQANDTADSWKKKLQNDTNQMQNYQYYKTFFQSQIKRVLDLSTNIPHELGIFEPPNSIKMVINSTSSQTIADYLETVTHEYLHYASYTPKKSFQDTFFEEGLTEYFARNIIRDELHTTTNLGYPIQVKIITEMTKVIPEVEFADIYFNKDEVRLEKTLDRVYGDGFYDHNKVLFETLQYSSDPKQTLKLANEIMKKIGGAPLKENDLYSSPSSF